MREGDSKTGNIEQLSTGYLKLASGTTAQRPTSVANGMVRFNTETGRAEIYQQGNWERISADQYNSDVYPLIVGNTTSSPAQFMTDPTRGNKFLSDTVLTFKYTNPSAANLAWLSVDPAITDANYGYIASTPMTITTVTGFASSKSEAKTVSLYINETEYPNLISFPVNSSSDGAISVGVNYDLNYGDKIRYRVRTNASGNIGAIMIVVYVKFRHPGAT